MFVGYRAGYKNFDRFIKSVSKLLHEDLNISIVCVGGHKFKNDELSLFKKFGIQNRVYHYELDDNLLAQFYSRALLFVFPSLYEGFGIPIFGVFCLQLSFSM